MTKRYYYKNNTAIKGGEINPESIDNLLAWWVADEAYITKDGSDLVSQWDAKVFNAAGDGSYWEQSVGVDQPTWSSTAVGGAPGMDFTSAFMTGQGSPSWLDEDPYDKTIVIVADNSAATVPSSNYFFSAQGTHRLYCSTGGRFNARIERQTTGANSFLSSAGELESSPFAVMFKIEEQTSGGTVHFVTDQYHSGAWENIINSTTATNGVANTFTNIYVLGALVNTGAGTLDFNMGEVIVYDSIITDDERDILTTYLTARYNLT